MKKEDLFEAIGNVESSRLLQTELETASQLDRDGVGTLQKKNAGFSGKKKLLLLLSAIIFIFSMASVCYASDVGGIRTTIQFWVHNEQTSAVVEIQNGNYTLYFEDAEGKQVEISGGGVYLNSDGSERPLTVEDIVEYLNRPEMEYKEDGTVWISYKSQVREIIDCFDTNGICFIWLETGRDRFYITAIKGHGFMASTNGFVPPDRFRIEQG